ncbi:ribosomal RNA-processing protein 8 [Phaenicophaeus curvirostris]|uniref:ribosomal RNA-processing protein 8 n=1 Tax=Phaenicophaeus curvirostris TaxID=33595 RepID=UPI0037F0A52F
MPAGPSATGARGAGKRRLRGAAAGEDPAPGARKRRRRRRQQEVPGGPDEEGDPKPAPEADGGASGRSSALRERMERRLLGARFRLLNERLYSCSSREAARLFQSDPDALRIYHDGFARQLARWPHDPLERIVQRLRKRPASLEVADFGCGDGRLARSLRNKVHGFDLAPLGPHVTVCDMAQVPLPSESVDVAVFCLALMGTNLQEILEEASRVLRLGGSLLVAEVASRFEDVRGFLSAMAQLGFKAVYKDLSSRFFFLFEFHKLRAPRGRPLPGLRLRPCPYKRR